MTFVAPIEPLPVERTSTPSLPVNDEVAERNRTQNVRDQSCERADHSVPDSPASRQLRESFHLPIFGASRREFTLKQEKLRDLEVSQLLFTLLGEERLEGRLWLRHFEPCQCQVRSEGALLAGKADLSHSLFDLFCELVEIGGRLHSYPAHSRTACVGKKAKTLQSNCKAFESAQILQACRYFSYFRIGNLTEELKSQMDSFRLGPPRVETDGTERGLLSAQCRADSFR